MPNNLTINKRVDIVINSKTNIRKRGFVSIKDNISSIIIKNKVIMTNDELESFCPYETIVVRR